jgi:hypothetical protein
VFWGVTESSHLVDIINQSDFVENIDTEDKLGQPMVSLRWLPEWGTLDLFLMPLHRERTFQGLAGRPRLPLPIDQDNPVYESSAAIDSMSPCATVTTSATGTLASHTSPAPCANRASSWPSIPPAARS